MIQNKICILILCFLVIDNGWADKQINLSKKNYIRYGESKAVILIHVNWGRSWGCSGNENAQLQELSFKSTTVGDTKVELKTPSKLFVDDKFIPYTLLVTPGKYGLSNIDVKIARNKKKIEHLIIGEAELFKSGNPDGGSFEVSGGEIAYLGHFGLDCTQEPIPWRYYVEGKEEFEGYVASVHKEFPFIQDKSISFKLFSTELFGKPYVLE